MTFHLAVTAWMLVVSAMAFNTCPEECSCYYSNKDQLTTDCRWRHLRKIPRNVDNQTQVLDVSYNRIVASASALDTLRRLANLAIVDFSGNNIMNLSLGTFRRNKLLQVLILRENPLVIQPGRPFLDASFMTRLDLSYCNVTRIPAEAFTLMPFLWELDLRGNKLQTLNPKVLGHAKSLLKLHLAHNPWKCGCGLEELRNWTLEKSVSIPEIPDGCWNVTSGDNWSCKYGAEFEDGLLEEDDGPLREMRLTEMALLYCFLGVVLVMAVIGIGIAGNCLRGGSKGVRVRSRRTRKESTKSLISVSSNKRTSNLL